MNNGMKRSALGPSLSSAAAITCRAVGHTSGQKVKPKKTSMNAPAEVLVRDALAGVIGEREGATDQRLPPIAR